MAKEARVEVTRKGARLKVCHYCTLSNDTDRTDLPDRPGRDFDGISDDQLRAECERRGKKFVTDVEAAWKVANEYRDAMQMHQDRAAKFEAERDEWKRKAEGLAEYDGDLGAWAEAMGYVKPITRRLEVESGPGLSTKPLASPQKRETVSEAELADLLCDDAP